MARIDKVREIYDDVTEKLFSDKAAFSNYLKFAGKFFKLPSSQSMTIYGTKPNAVMVTDYDTWQKFGRQVKRGTTSIAVINNVGGLKHYFDVSQTDGAKIPYQWTLDKATAAALLDEINESEGRRFQSLGGCINYLGAEKAREVLPNVLNTLNISETDRTKFEKSFTSMVQNIIAARCELGCEYRYNGELDLSAFDLLHSKAEKEKLCEFVQFTGKSVLLNMEQSINNIILQGRTNDYGRNKTDMVRGGQEVLPRVQGGERQTVQTRPENVRVSSAGGTWTDGRGAGVDERGHREVRGEVAEVYGGKLSRSNSVADGAAEMVSDTASNRQGNSGISDNASETVREEKSQTDHIRGDNGVGEHARNDSRQGNNGGHSSSVSRVSGEEKSATYSTSSQKDKAEEHSPAFSLSPEQQYIADKTAEFLGYAVEKSLVETIYNKAFGYAYDIKLPIEQIPDDELKEIISEVTNAKEKPEIPDDLDKIYVDKDSKTVRMVFYNPDSAAGGQLVYNEFDFDDIANALTHENPIDYLLSSCKQTALDVDMDGLDKAAREFLADTEDFNSRDEQYLDKLFALAEPVFIRNFKAKTAENFVPIDGQNAVGIEDSVREYVQGILDDNEINAQIVDLAVIGSRSRNLNDENSDLDIAVEFKSDLKEDALFNILHENSLEIGGVRVDINPIRAEETGTLGEYLRNAEKTIIENHERKKAQEQPSIDEIISEIRKGKTVKITEKSADEQMITNARKQKFSNITLQYDEDSGFHIRADTEKIKGAIITVFGRNEQAVRDYIAKNAEQMELSSTRHIATVGGTGYFLMDKPFSFKTAPEIKEKCDKYIIAAPALNLADDFLKSNNITFLKLHRDISESVFEKSPKEIVAAMTSAEKAVSKVESTIHFGLLGYGVTVYDTSKTDEKTHDFPIVAHISPEGFINYRVDKNSLNDADISRIENQAESVKMDFVERWNRLSVGTRYGQILDAANALPKPQWDVFFADKTALTMDEAVEKYEHSLIFRDGEFPEAKRSVTAYRVGDFYEVYNEDAQVAAELLNLSQTTRRGVPMAGFPAHVLDDYKRNFAMHGYYLKIGDSREIEKIFAEKSETKKSLDTLKVGDLVRNSEGLWRITKIDGDFSINFENTDKSANMSGQSIVGHWKEGFEKRGFEYVSPAELTADQLLEIEKTAAKTKPKTAEVEQYGEQLNLFGEPMHEVETPEKNYVGGVDVEQALMQDIVSHGTMFQDGKFRVEEFYRAHKSDTKDFAKFIAKEYGTGGHSGDGKVSLVSYDNKGIAIRIRLDNGEDTTVNWSWKKVANRIATLIDKGEYITSRDIDERIKNAEYEIKHNEQGTKEYESAAKILDEYGLLPTENQQTELDRAKALINDFCEQEYGDEGEFKDLTRVDLAFTEDEETGLPINVYADLDKLQIVSEFNGVSVRVDEYSSLKEINDIALSELNFDELILDTITANEQQKEIENPSKAEDEPVKLKSIVIDLTPRQERIEEFAPNEQITEQATEQKTDVRGQAESPVKELHIGDKFRSKSTGEVSEVVSLEGALPWYTDQCTISRVSDGVIITENASIEMLLNAQNYEYLGNDKERSEQPVKQIKADAPKKAENDFTITDEHLGEGGAKAKYSANIAAIKTLKQIESENRAATPEEQKTLSKYVGWGGVPQAFDGDNSTWATEYAQLKSLLTPDEYEAARGSVLNAHYTSPTVIHAIYSGLQNLGFEGGNILEPAMGVGNFFGAMPQEMRKNSSLSGVELDSITGRIAQQLYPSADVQIKGYEKTNFSDNFFDVVVGNVPFGSYGVSDKRYNRENFFIHDYFIAKSLDKVAPGGIVAVVTTKGTLDKENPRVREYLAKRADLVGAIRLPNNAFKANAGTEVTSDILFFQKREEMAVELPDWCYVSKNSDSVPVNNYFIDHPEMILGEMKQGMEFSMYGNANETACVPIEGANLAEQLEKAVANLKLDNALKIHRVETERKAGIIPARADVRNFTFAEVDGKMYFRENNIMTEVTDGKGKPIAGKKLERLKALNELRQTFRTILSAQENDCTNEKLQELQKALNEQYDGFVKKFGHINDNANCQVFGKDDDYNSLCALEVVNEETKEITKSDIFSQRTIKHYAEITHVETPQEAMYVAIDALGRPDIKYMSQLCGKEPKEVIEALKADNLIYLNPEKADEKNKFEGWEETSEYLSGNVRVKLKIAELAAKGNPDFSRNVAALQAVIPKRIEAGDISARIGVHWVDVEDYKQFLQEYIGVKFQQELRRNISGEYKIANKGWFNSAATTQIYGTSRINAYEIFENLLNCRDVVVRDKKTDPATGKDIYVINQKETQLAQEKARQMKETFSKWLWENPERREKYVTRYNELFNSIVGRKYDGSHQTFPGMSPFIKLKPHQLDAIARAKFGGNTLLAHCVGAGKSFEMVAATMEKKRLGLINKACVVVPKSLVGQMAAEWLRLYPQAKILTATEKDFDKDHRQKFIGRCCTGEYDAVIMSYEQFEKTSMSFEYRRDFIKREIEALTEGLEELQSDYRTARDNRGSIKDIERVKKSLERKLDKLIEDNGKVKDTSLNFEQLGFDSLVVDEAHNYKNGLVVTKMSRVAGVQTTPAQKSEDILMKTQYLNENYGERNIIFATGTPVSNSMVELYIMQRYLRPSLLAQAGLQTFDDWANTFGEVVSKAELKPAGAEQT